MKYVLLFWSTDPTWDSSAEENQKTMAAVGQWFAQLGASGKYLGGEELQRARTAATVRFESGAPVVTDGPFLEAKETVAGYALVEVASRDEAVDLASGWPGGGPVEVRPIVDHSQDAPAP
jgi:hypothetical protein